MNDFEYEYKLLSELISRGVSYKGFLKYLYRSPYLKELCSIYIKDLEMYVTKESNIIDWPHTTYKHSLISELEKNKVLYHRCILSYIQSLKERDFINLLKELP